MAIKIIGAGLPRTGTNTLKESLERLGYRKTYHMKELLVRPENLHYWLTLKILEKLTGMSFIRAMKQP